MIVATMLSVTPTTVIHTLFANDPTIRVPCIKEENDSSDQPIGHSDTLPDMTACDSLKETASTWTRGRTQLNAAIASKA